MSGSASFPSLKTKTFTANLAQNAATYDLFTAQGNVLVKSIVLYTTVAGTDFTTAAFATNDTTPVILLAATIAANVTVGLQLAQITTPFVLGNGKKARYTLVGDGSAGTVIAVVEYHNTSGDLI